MSSGPRKVSTGCWVWVPNIACCKTPAIFELMAVLLHFSSPADTVPPKGGGFCEGHIVAYDSW